jgi:hypothetical protein
VDKLTGNKVTLTLAMGAAAILLLFVGMPGTTMISAQTSTTATNAANTITAGSSNNTMIPSMQKICPTAESNGSGQSQSSSMTGMSNNTSNTDAVSSSNRTMQGRPNPNNTTSNTANNNIPIPSEGNLSAIGRSIGQARTDLIEGCNAVNNGDSGSALVHLNLVARALDNIEGNLSSTMATGGGGITTNLPPTGGTSTSSVEGATTSERSGS